MNVTAIAQPPLNEMLHSSLMRELLCESDNEIFFGYVKFEKMEIIGTEDRQKSTLPSSFILSLRIRGKSISMFVEERSVVGGGWFCH